MRRPRLRFTVRQTMVAVAFVGILFGGMIAFAKRPTPTDTYHIETDKRPGLSSGPFGNDPLYQAWSDGWVIRVDDRHTYVQQRMNYGPLMQVRWSDGSSGWYWRRPHHHHALEQVWDGSQTWHHYHSRSPGTVGGFTRRGPFPRERPPR